jgi:hypothetical protein
VFFSRLYARFRPRSGRKRGVQAGLLRQTLLLRVIKRRQSRKPSWIRSLGRSISPWTSELAASASSNVMTELGRPKESPRQKAASISISATSLAAAHSRWVADPIARFEHAVLSSARRFPAIESRLDMESREVTRGTSPRKGRNSPRSPLARKLLDARTGSTTKPDPAIQIWTQSSPQSFRALRRLATSFGGST